MIRDRIRVATLVFALLPVITSCTSEPWACGMGAACPAMAEVDGVQYQTTAPTQLEGIEDSLTPVGQLSRTNTPGHYADLAVYSVAAIDPRAVLIARGASRDSYVILWGPNQAAAWPAFCDYLPTNRLMAQPECGAPA